MSIANKGRFVSAFCGGNNKEPYCIDCKNAGREHAVEDRREGFTSRHSFWGEGIPTTIRVCTGCGAQDGPWVSADIVGGMW
jgi:hypothetical protein